MYSLKEAWVKMHGDVPFDGWDGTIYCKETDAATTFSPTRHTATCQPLRSR